VKLLREQLATVERRQLEIERTLASEFPAYDVFANPQPMSLAETQKLLRENEALVKLSDGTGLLWVITSNGAQWVKIAREPHEFADKVGALRCGLDRTAWDGEPQSSCARIFEGQQIPADGQPLPFDLVRAHDLYTSLFGNIEQLIKGKQLLIVPSGPLAQLPFQVLVTEKPDPVLSGTDAFRHAAWFAKRHAISVLPTVTSLKALRQQAKTSRATKPFIGVGNPLLNGANEGYAMMAKASFEKQQCAKTAWQPIDGPIVMRGGVRALIQRGGLANVADIRAQSPLPETADELCAVARDLRVTNSDILLGARANERDIKSLSENGGLADYRIVHFATHGVLAGELAPNTEPGLILTPPDKATAEDDGYLSASEIAALKLDADWVILSACNTAAGGADKAEALSGVARAFFYAGARALLVSHWAVYSDSTVKLITKALSTIAADKTIGRSEALRRSMVALIEQGAPHEAHPAYWAPFIVVGEGGSPIPSQLTTQAIAPGPTSIVPPTKEPARAKAKTGRPKNDDWKTTIWR
jgi:CHAT domain-containing protein